MKNYYDVLEVSNTTTKVDIHKAFRKLAQRYHPDTGGKFTTDTDKFKDINEAYEVLKDDEKRLKYDKKLQAITKRASNQNSRNENEYLTLEEMQNQINRSRGKKMRKKSHYGFRERVFLFRILFGIVFGMVSVFSYERMVDTVPLSFYPFGAFLGAMGIIGMSTPTPYLKNHFKKLFLHIDGFLYVFLTFFSVFFGSMYGKIIAFQYGGSEEYISYGIMTGLVVLSVWAASTEAFLKKLILPRTYKTLLGSLAFVSMVHVSFVLIAIYFETAIFVNPQPYLYTTLGFVLSNFVVYFGHFDRVKKRNIAYLFRLLFVLLTYSVLTAGFFWVYYSGDISFIA